MANKIGATFKSSDTEETIDVIYTRPIGYLWAKLFERLDVHPNTVTVMSMILGAAAGLCFRHGSYMTEGTPGLIWNAIGVLLLTWANFYDSADGQLARMTGKKTELGRILDGAAADIWYISIYVCLLIRMWGTPIPFLQECGIVGEDGTPIQWGIIAFFVLSLEGFICHTDQCRMSDYIRNIHLYFVKGNAGSELAHYDVELKKFRALSWKRDFIRKFFQMFYINYTRMQEHETPQFQKLRKTLEQRFPDGNIPQDMREDFRKRSFPLLKYTNFLTFNWRALALYAACLSDRMWILLVFEIVIMTIVQYHMHWSHERMCKKFMQDYSRIVG